MQQVTRNDVKIVIGIASIIIAIVLAWANLANMVRNIADKDADQSLKIQEISREQNDIALDVREIKTALKIKGIISYTPSEKNLATNTAGQSATPAPTASQAPQVVVQNYSQPQTQSEPTPTPFFSSPPPTPTPTPAPVVPAAPTI